MADVRCIDEKQILKSANVILELAEKTSKLDLTQALDEKPVVVQITFKKIPKVQNQVVKIPLPETITHSNTEVCLFTKDLDKSSRDYEPTIRHYKDLLDAAGVRQEIAVIPYKCLVLEYQPYEAKRNLSNMYDIFLADDRITHRLPTLLGKNFLARKKYPIRVNLGSSKLKQEIERALSMTQCIVTGRGSSCQVTVARTGLTAEQIANNVKVAIKKVTECVPGGCDNIRNIHIKTPDSPSLPVYISFGKRDDVKLPKKKERSLEIEPEEVTTVEGALVKITQYGDITLVRKPVGNGSVQKGKAARKRCSANEVAKDKLAEESVQEAASSEDEDDDINYRESDKVPCKRKQITKVKNNSRKKHSLTSDSEKRESSEDSGSEEEPSKAVNITKMAVKKKMQKSIVKQKQGGGGLKKKRKLEDDELAKSKVNSSNEVKKSPKQPRKENRKRLSDKSNLDNLELKAQKKKKVKRSAAKL